MLLGLQVLLKQRMSRKNKFCKSAGYMMQVKRGISIKIEGTSLHLKVILKTLMKTICLYIL